MADAGLLQVRYVTFRTAITTYPDLLPGRRGVVRAALHKDEMCRRQVQSAIRGFVTEAIQQSHLLHLTKTHDDYLSRLDVAVQYGWSFGRLSMCQKKDER